MTAPPLQWIKQQTVMNTSTNDQVPSVASDSAGNIYVAYVTNGTVSGGTLAGSADIVVSKIDTNGNVIWIKQQSVMNTSVGETNPSIAVNSTGIYVAYQTIGTVSGGTKAGNIDIAVFKMDTDGNVTWIKQQTVMNASNSDNFYPSIAVDSAGNTYVAYLTYGTVSGGETNAGFLTDIAVFKLDTNGNVTWIKQQTVNKSAWDFTDTFPSIAVDSAGNTYVAYFTGETVSGGTLTGSFDIVVFKMDTNGNVTWIKQQAVMNSSGNDFYPSIAVNSTGIYVAYQTTGTVSGGTSAGGDDIVVFKMDTNGNVTWIKQQTVVNTSNSDVDPSITIDSVGNVYVAYRTSGTVSGGATAGGIDIVVFKMDTNGNVTWVKQQTAMNSSGTDLNQSITIDSNGNIYVAYQTNGTVSGGTTAGNNDIVVFKLGFPAPPVAPTITANPTVLSPTSIRYNWTALPSLTYTITLTDDAGTTITQSSLSTDNATFSTLATGTNYTATIYATDIYNQISPTATYMTVPLGISPSAPTIKRNPQVSPTLISYHWTPLPATISSYTITLTGTGSGTGTQTVPSSTSVYTFTGLTQGATYTATIFATDFFNQSSSVATYNTVQTCGRPGPPTIVNFNASNGTLNVTWAQPDDDGGSPIQWYVIRDTNRTKALTFGVEPFRRQYAVSIPTGTYNFQIAAVNFAGHGTPVVSSSLTF